MKPKLQNTLSALSLISLLACFPLLDTEHYILAFICVAGFGMLSKLGGLWWEKEE